MFCNTWNGTLNLRLFDAGANGSDGAQGQGAAGAGAGESALNHAADAGQEESKSRKGNDLSQVVYGKPPEQGQTDPLDNANTSAGDSEQRAKASFDELIRGDYKEDFEKKTQAIIGSSVSPGQADGAEARRCGTGARPAGGAILGRQVGSRSPGASGGGGQLLLRAGGRRTGNPGRAAGKSN